MTTQKSRRAEAVLVMLGSILLVSCVLSGFHYFQTGYNVQVQAARQWAASQSDFSVASFYKIQKEQLQLRLNELALQENLDEQVLQNYNLRIAQYSNDIESFEKTQAKLESEARTFEGRRDEALRHSQWFMAAAIGLALSIILAAMNLLAQGRGLLVFATLLLLASCAAIVNGVLLIWK